jgi:Tol biopolymer transport system component
MHKKMILCLAIVFFIGISTSHGKDKSQNWKASETLIHKIESGIKPEAIWASPDKKHVAYEAIVSGTRIFFLDGKEKTPLSNASGFFFESKLVFSRDGKRLAYERRANRKYSVIIEGEDEKQFSVPDGARVAYIAFSPDGKRVAFKVENPDAKKQFVAVDGKMEKEYEFVTWPIFTTDSKRAAYLALESGQVFTVIEGKEEKIPHAKGYFGFSPDGNHQFYKTKQDDKWRVVVDEQESPPYDDIGPILFSPDSKRVAYLARQGGKWFAVVDGKKGKDYMGYWEGTLRFSPDSKRVAYIVTEPGPWKEQTLGHTTIMGRAVGSPAKGSPKRILVVDGKEVKKFDYGTPFVNNAGWEKPKTNGTLIFSPDNKRVAYTGIKGSIRKTASIKGADVHSARFSVTKWFAGIDGKEEKPYDEIKQGSLVFSPDGKHLAYIVKVNKKWAVVVDGKERKPYDSIVSCWETISFDSSDTFRYVAQEGGNIYLVEETLR